MRLATAILAAANVSLAMSVLCVGLRASPREAQFLPRHRGMLFRSLLAISVVTPLFALWAALVFELRQPVAVALVALALSPLPSFLPTRTLKLGGDTEFSLSLCVVSDLLSVALIPMSVVLLAAVYSPPHIGPGVVAGLLATSVLLPLLAGAAVRRMASDLANRAVKPIAIASTCILGVALAAMLPGSLAALPQVVEHDTFVAVVLMTLVGLGIGHVCGGPARRDRTALAIATTERHPALAIAIGTIAFPNDHVAGAVILFSLFVGTIATMAYMSLSRFALPRL
jgi:bile acid:Na+ symporter, BASS family